MARQHGKKWTNFQKFASNLIFRYLHDKHHLADRTAIWTGFSYDPLLKGSVSFNKKTNCCDINTDIDFKRIEEFRKDDTFKQLIYTLTANYYEIRSVLPRTYVVWEIIHTRDYDIKISIPKDFTNYLKVDKEVVNILNCNETGACGILYDKLIDLSNEHDSRIMLALKDNNEYVYKLVNWLHGTNS